MDTGLSFFGSKGLPQGRALSLLTSPHNDAQLQVPSATSWIKGMGNGSWEGHRCPEEVGKGSWLSNSYSSTTIRVQASPFWLGLLPGAILGGWGAQGQRLL